MHEPGDDEDGEAMVDVYEPPPPRPALVGDQSTQDSPRAGLHASYDRHAGVTVPRTPSEDALELEPQQ